MLNVRRANTRWMDIEMAELDLTRLFTHYAHSNRSDGKSPKTVSWYGEMLADFVKFLSSTNRDLVLSEFSAETVREYIIAQQERGLSPFTVQSKVRALKAFSSWLFAEQYTPGNLLSNVKLPRAPIKLIEPLTATEIDRLIGMQNPLTTMGSRNIAILITLLDTGLRASELCNLRLCDAHIEQGYLKVMGKRSKERIVPIGALVRKVLWRYVFHLRPKPLVDDDDYLLLNVDGKRLQLNAVKLLLGRWGKTAGVPRLHAHLCRHTYATNFLDLKCGDLFRLQQILGHITLEMVRRYVHYASAQAMIEGHVSSPVDRSGLKKLRDTGDIWRRCKIDEPHQLSGTSTMSRTYLEINEVENLEKAASNVHDRLLIRIISHLGYRVSEAIAITLEGY